MLGVTYKHGSTLGCLYQSFTGGPVAEFVYLKHTVLVATGQIGKVLKRKRKDKM